MNSKQNQRRLARERRTIEVMIGIFCRGNHHTKSLCAECRDLSDYALHRIDKCPFAEDKPTCVQCTVHCYVPAMRQRVREVMRYAGPRMLWHHPILALRHYLDAKTKTDN